MQVKEWKDVQKAFNNPTECLARLQSFEFTKLTDKMAAYIAKTCENPEFTADFASKVSAACA